MKKMLNLFMMGMALSGIAQADVTRLGNVNVDDFWKGYDLGQRNGGITVDRLQERTTHTQGCSALSKLQDALVKVTRTIRPPAHSSVAVSRGFYQGYVDALRIGVKESREECDVVRFHEGDFAGSLYGSVLCQISTVSVDIVNTVVLDPLYEDWSGGSEEIISQCQSTAQLTLKSCGQSDLTEVLQMHIDEGCSDLKGTRP